jgi:thiol-disulfide isomerase/thioredoxin
MRIKLSAAVLLMGAVAAPSTVLSAETIGQETKGQETEKKEDEKRKNLTVGSTVPESLSLPNFMGEDTSFKDLRGKVVILHFWSYRCPAERHANPIFMKMEERYAGNKDVVMVGICSNQNELGAKPAKGADYSKHYESLRKKASDVGYKHKLLVDHGNKISDLFQARSTPHCYVIDKKGVIQYSGALDDDPRGKKGKDATNYLVEATTAILAGKRPEITTTKPYG